MVYICKMLIASYVIDFYKFVVNIMNRSLI